MLLGCATAVWTTNRASEANITVANNAETLVFQNFMIVIVWEYYLANRLINSALKTAKYRLYSLDLLPQRYSLQRLFIKISLISVSFED